MSQRISAVSGSKVTESRSTFRGRIVVDTCFLFADSTFRSRRYAVSSAEVTKNDGQKCQLRLGANFFEDEFSPNCYGG